jgi:hypothetical protein
LLQVLIAGICVLLMNPELVLVDKLPVPIDESAAEVAPVHNTFEPNGEENLGPFELPHPTFAAGRETSMLFRQLDEPPDSNLAAAVDEHGVFVLHIMTCSKMCSRNAINNINVHCRCRGRIILVPA